MKRRPNILFLMCDQYRADISGFEGNTIIQTPTIDYLAKTGVVFQNAYTPSPICIPARQCMMAGQLPRTCKCERFEEDLEPGYETFARSFSRYAYATVACGKLHHVGTDQMQGWTHRIGSEMHMNYSFIEGRKEEEFKKHVRPKSETRWSNAKEVRMAGIGKARQVVEDEYAIQGALNFIEDYFLSPYYDKERLNQPLLLKISLTQPHYPYTADEKKFMYYLNRVEPCFNQTVSTHPYLCQKQVIPGVDASEREIRRCVAAYYAMIETMDDHFKKIIDALEYVGQDLDEWIIVFTSDHGEMLGEHGVWAKHKFYEGSVRVPLIIRWSKNFNGNRKVDKNVNLCDLYATLCDLCEIPIPDNLDSRSLVPLLRNEDIGWDNESISQYNGEYIMIKRDHLKYQYYGNEMPEVLFDLTENPEETIDYINNSEYKDAIDYFRKRRAELGF